MSEQTASMGNSRTACQALHNHPRLSNDIWKSCHDLHANGNRLSLRGWTTPQLFWLLRAQRLCECSPTAPSTLVPSGDPFTRRFFLQDLCTSSTGELTPAKDGALGAVFKDDSSPEGMEEPQNDAARTPRDPSSLEPATQRLSAAHSSATSRPDEFP